MKTKKILIDQTKFNNKLIRHFIEFNQYSKKLFIKCRSFMKIE